DKCDAALHAGDSCQVAAGTYAQTLNPAQSGSAGSPITYVCPGRNCLIKPASGDAMDLRNRSRITVDGFIFEGGKAYIWGGASTGNVITNVRSQDTDGYAPFAQLEGQGGTGNTLSNFTLEMPVWDAGNPNVQGFPLSIGIGANPPESGTLIKDGLLRGGWNT